MPNYGFGGGAFGNDPFGDVDWAKVVLWDEMPDRIKEDDEAAGHPYLKFVQGMAPSFEYLRRYIARFKTITDPIQIRNDLLLYFARNFGITIDLAEPEAYRRMRSQLAARWNIIKGTVNAYTILCRVHGFEVNIIPLWWNGFEFVENGPTIHGEASTNTHSDAGGKRTWEIRLGCAPVEPGTITLRFDASGTPFSLTDDLDAEGYGELVGSPKIVSSSIDYGWGYIVVTLDNTTDTFSDSEYGSVTGGCADGDCKRCKTHRLRLRITPGDIATHDELTVAEAFQRLYKKIGAITGNGVVPIHVEIEQLEYAATAYLSIGNRYDIIPADVVAADTGLQWVVP